MRKTPVYLAFLVLVIGGLFFSVNGSAVTSKYDGSELDQDHSKDHPMRISWENLKENWTKLITISIEEYITKPDGSIFNVDFKNMKASVNTGIIWDYVKIIPEATITLISAKVIEFIKLLVSSIILLCVSASELINTIIGITYDGIGIEWEYDRHISAEAGIAFRTIEIYTPSTENASIAQMINYIFGLVVSILLIVTIIKIIDNLIGIVGWDIPFI